MGSVQRMAAAGRRRGVGDGRARRCSTARRRAADLEHLRAFAKSRERRRVLRRARDHGHRHHGRRRRLRRRVDAPARRHAAAPRRSSRAPCKVPIYDVRSSATRTDARLERPRQGRPRARSRRCATEDRRACSAVTRPPAARRRRRGRRGGPAGRALARSCARARSSPPCSSTRAPTALAPHLRRLGARAARRPAGRRRRRPRSRGGDRASAPTSSTTSTSSSTPPRCRCTSPTRRSRCAVAGRRPRAAGAGRTRR